MLLVTASAGTGAGDASMRWAPAMSAVTMAVKKCMFEILFKRRELAYVCGLIFRLEMILTQVLLNKSVDELKKYPQDDEPFICFEPGVHVFDFYFFSIYGR